MNVTTVLGEVAPGDLGPTLPHEHLFIDLTNQFAWPSDPGRRALAAEPVQMSNLGVLRRNPYAVRDNMLVDDLDVCVDEVARFARLGGRTIVDCTSAGLKRRPLALREVAARTGVNVVAGCGYYTSDTHPADMLSRSPASIADEMIRDLTEGIDGTDVRAGVMGEIGTSAEIHPGERLALRGAALAFRTVPAAIHVHTYPWARVATDVADELIAGGVDPARIVINHLDVDIDPAYVRAVLDRGVVVELDCFGKEYPIDPGSVAFAPAPFATDVERIDLVLRILDWGFERQVLLTNDLCFKTMLCAYGGWGYGHILEHIVPLLRQRGVDNAMIERLVVGNPASVLAGD
jgi:phosphotriesterase-related protein